MNFDLRQWRIDHNMTQAELAEKSGAYLIGIGKYEKGISISKKTEDRILNFVKRYGNGGFYTSQDNYKPAQMSVDDLWKFLPADIKYIAKDESGAVYGFKAEPKYNYQSKEWVCDLGCLNIPLNIDFEDVESDNSLVKRPYNFFDFVGKYGVFFDNDENTLVFGRLEGITGNGSFCRENSTFTYANFRPLTDNEKENLG